MHQDLSFDFTIQSRYKKHDPTERIRSEIRVLEEENYQLETLVTQVNEKPWLYIQDTQELLTQKIRQLRKENQGLQELISKSKMPGYAQMTKKKGKDCNDRQVTNTPNADNFTPLSSSRNFDMMRSSVSDMRNSSMNDQMDMGSEKGQASTCQNFPLDHSPITDPIECLQPLQHQQLQARTRLTMQLLQVIQNTSAIQSQLHQFQQNNQEGESNRLKKCENTMEGNKQKLQKISQYKKKLLSLLKKLRNRQSSVHQVVEQYKKMHQQTLKQLQEAIQVLNDLQAAHVSENLDDMYAQVLQLEERLRYIDEQLERLDEEQWMRDVYHQLIIAMKKLGLSFSSSINGQDKLRQKIDEACQILIECVAHQKVEDRDRLILLKFYHEEEKENNGKIIKQLQKKEQLLSKKLIDMQMNQ